MVHQLGYEGQNREPNNVACRQIASSFSRLSLEVSAIAASRPKQQVKALLEGRVKVKVKPTMQKRQQEPATERAPITPILPVLSQAVNQSVDSREDYTLVDGAGMRDDQPKCLFPIAARSLQQDRNIIFNQFVCFVMARLLNLELSALLLPTRGTAKAAFARQLAMYLCHVIGQQSQAAIGTFFSRDRKTVSHACQLIEDMREERCFNDDLERIEILMTVVVAQLKVV